MDAESCATLKIQYVTFHGFWSEGDRDSMIHNVPKKFPMIRAIHSHLKVIFYEMLFYVRLGENKHLLLVHSEDFSNNAAIESFGIVFLPHSLETRKMLGFPKVSQ